MYMLSFRDNALGGRVVKRDALAIPNKIAGRA